MSSKKTDKKISLLVVEDDSGVQNQLKWALSEKFDLKMVENREAAIKAVKDFNPAIIVLDLGLPPDANGATEGLATLRYLSENHPLIKVIVASGNSELKNAMEAIQLGAYDFYAKPIDIDILTHIIERAWHVARLEIENVRRNEVEIGKKAIDGIITGDPAMIKCCETVLKIAPADIGVLITGESGTGKELFANALYVNSHRATGPMVAINCAAIPENLLESELFGYEKGAFTGAVSTHPGKIEMANKGVLFLDEIGDLPLSLQAKLLRFLEDQKIERLGGNKKIQVDVRVISATHQNLADMIAQGKFREDLYYRLNEFNLMIPPLRDREGDVELLAKYFLTKYSAQLHKAIKGINQRAMDILLRHHWPGNVRELENKIKKAIILTDKNMISPADIEMKGIDDINVQPLQIIREKYEKDSVRRALLQTRGNISLAAKLLDISRPKLYEMIETYEIAL